MARTHRSDARGFTLVELLVSLLIFTVIATMTHFAFDATDRGVRSIERQLDDLLAMQRMMQTITNDLAQLQPRPVREPVGSSFRPALLADSRNDYFVELTRGGYANPLGVPRATAQRVGYRFEDGDIIRAQWPVLDNLLATEPAEIVLLEDLEAIDVRFLDETGNWLNQWPGGTAGVGAAPPIAIEVTIEHPQWGQILRLVEIGG
ncbi:MAG: type II secretion system minor pseudopilin GspJ [Pseudomonadota bacterium]